MPMMYPASQSVPVNLLRLHIDFGGQVRLTGWPDGIRLFGDDKIDITDALFQGPGGIWSHDGDVLTVLFHPGVVKTGVGLGAKSAPGLEIGRRYRLEIDLSAFGAGEGAVSKKFTVSDAERSPIDPESWRLRFTEHGGLHLVTGRLIDLMSFQANVGILTSDGTPIAYRIARNVEDGFLLEPLAGWPDGPITIVVDDHLEDVCGNRPFEPFERKQTAPQKPSFWQKTIPIGVSTDRHLSVAGH